MINYRILLSKYMAHIIDKESVSMLDYYPALGARCDRDGKLTHRITVGEMIELRRIERELFDE